MINKLNKITLPIIMIITLTFSILQYIGEFNKGNGVESLGILIQVALFLITSLLAYLKRYYAASIFIILFKLLFVKAKLLLKYYYLIIILIFIQLNLILIFGQL